MKWVFGILGGLVLLVALLLGTVFWATSGVTAAADEFFAALARDDRAAARAMLSEGFVTSSSPAQIDALFADPQLSQVSSASWSKRSVNNNLGSLEGALTTETGGTVPISLELISEKGEWKIHALQLSPAGISNNRSSLPDSRQQVELVRQTTADFVKSLAAGEMDHFHGSISSLFRDQYSVDELNVAYAPLIKLDADLTVLNRLAPQFDAEPQIDDQGRMTISGSYPTEPSEVTFRYIYVREGMGWALLGLHMNVG